MKRKHKRSVKPRITEAQENATILLEEVTLKRSHPFGGQSGVVVELGAPTNGCSNVKVMLTHRGRRLIVRATRADVVPAKPERANVFHAYDRAVQLGLGWSGEKLTPAELM